MTKYLVLAAVLLGTTACGDTWGQRAVTGGGIGAGSGAVIGALTPLGVLPGALIGTAVGAGGGTGVVLATSGEEVRIPAGTTLRTTLQEPLTVRVPIE